MGWHISTWLTPYKNLTYLQNPMCGLTYLCTKSLTYPQTPVCGLIPIHKIAYASKSFSYPLHPMCGLTRIHRNYLYTKSLTYVKTYSWNYPCNESPTYPHIPMCGLTHIRGIIRASIACYKIALQVAGCHTHFCSLHQEVAAEQVTPPPTPHFPYFT